MSEALKQERDSLRAALQAIIDAFDAEDHPVPSPYLRKHIDAARKLLLNRETPHIGRWETP